MKKIRELMLGMQMLACRDLDVSATLQVDLHCCALHSIREWHPAAGNLL